MSDSSDPRSDCEPVVGQLVELPRLPRPRLLVGWRVGVYGGSFDPIHAGHVQLALAAQRQLDLERVLVLPTARPPHKDEAAHRYQRASIAHRMAMVEAALAGHEALLLADDEARPEIHYTIDTLESLAAEYPGVRFVLLLGEDSYRELHEWRRWRDIVAGWDVAVMPRSASAQATASAAVVEQLKEHVDRRHHELDVAEHPASSRKIRECLLNRRPMPEGWLAAPVLSLIRRHGLYRGVRDQQQPRVTVDHEVALENSNISAEQQWTSEPDQSATSSPKPDEGPHSTSSRPLPPEVELAVAAVLDRQAIDPVLLQATEVCDFADYFLICTGGSDRQVAAIADGVQRRLRKGGEKPLHVEGERRANWVLIDYGHLIVHVFDPATRDFYRLERLWDDAPRIDLANFETSILESRGPDAESPSGGSAEEE